MANDTIDLASIVGLASALEAARARLLVVALSALPSDTREVVEAWYVVNRCVLNSAGQIRSLRQALSARDRTGARIACAWISRIRGSAQSIGGALVVLDGARTRPADSSPRGETWYARLLDTWMEFRDTLSKLDTALRAHVTSAPDFAPATVAGGDVASAPVATTR